MDITVLAPLINREPKSFIGAFILDSTPRTAGDLENKSAELLGFDKVSHLRKAYPGLNRESCRSYINTSLSQIIEGNPEGGYRLKGDFLGIRTLFCHALSYSSHVGVSLYTILRINSAGTNVCSILDALSGGEPLRVEDIRKQLETIHSSIIVNHLMRMDKIGLVHYENYSEGVQFQWDQKKANSTLEDDVIKELADLPQYRSHTRYRVMQVGQCLYDHFSRPMGADEITDAIPYSKSNSSRKFTQYALRILERLGYAVPTNDFNRLEHKSKVTITPFGMGFQKFIKKLERWESLPPIEVPITSAIACLGMYGEANPQRQSAQERQAQIISIVRSQPGLLEKEISDQIGTRCHHYLADLYRRGILHVEGKGTGYDAFKYYANLTPSRECEGIV